MLATRCAHEAIMNYGRAIQDIGESCDRTVYRLNYSAKAAYPYPFTRVLFQTTANTQ